MASRSGRRGQLDPPGEHEAFLEGLDKWKDDDSLSSAEDAVQKGQGNKSSAPQKKQEGCRVCGKDDDHKNLMLCDNCLGEYHIFCVGLQAVPPGDWFCIHCKPHRPPEHHRIDDGLDELVCALPPRYTERFGEIVWAQGGVGFGWWPSFIYDPRLTVGGARDLARKNMGKKHLVFFLECHMAPFSVLGDARLVKWENGLAEDYHLGKAAHAHSKVRGMAFRQALHIACLEEGKPVGNRMAWNHLGDAVPLDERVPLSPMKVKRKQRPSSKEQHEKESDVSESEKPPKRRQKSRAKKEPSTLASPSRADLLRATAIAGTPVRHKTPSTYYCRVIKRVSDKSDDEIDVRLGFIMLESPKSTFLDARAAIQEDMDPETLPEVMWKFDLPSLGVVSKNQERSLGPVASFFQGTFQGTFGDHIGDGSVENPFHLVIVGVDPQTYS